MTQEMPENIWAYEGYGQDGRGTWYNKDITGEFTPPNTVIKYILKSKYNTLEAENKELKKVISFIKDDGCFDMKSYEITELKVLYASKCEENKEMREAVNSVRDLIENSEGVYGLHQNGDFSPWDELRTGGHFEEWLINFDEALKGNEDGK